MRRLLLLIILVCGLLLTLPLHAQEDDAPPDHPLIDLLRLTPDELATPAFTYYFDFNAAADSRDYIPQVTDVDQWQELGLPPTSYTGRWLSLPGVLNDSVLFSVAGAPDVVGFDFFAVDRVLGFGAPPQDAVIWQGDFDQDAIIEAHTTRDYTEVTRGEQTVLCGPQGCDQPPVIDYNAVNMSNLIDPSLGRALPILLLEDGIVSAGEISVMDAMASVDGSSLYDNIMYQRATMALLDAGGEDAELIQMQFVPVNDFVRKVVDFDELETLDPLPDALRNFNDPETGYAPWADGYGELPPSALVAFGDFQNGDEQIAVMVVVPEDGLAATLTGYELERRLARFTNRAVYASNLTVLERFDGSVLYTVYGDDEEAVAVLTVCYPNPPAADETTPNNDIYPAQIYRIWVQALQRGTFYPLWDVSLP